MFRIAKDYEVKMYTINYDTFGAICIILLVHKINSCPKKDTMILYQIHEGNHEAGFKLEKPVTEK